MKKLLLLILLLPLLSFGQITLDTVPQNKNVVLEEFTGIYCGFCPDGHVMAQNIKNAYPNDVFILNLHTGSYASPQQGDPDFRVAGNSSIANISNIAGYPAGTVNRYQFPMTQGGGTAISRGDWADAASEILASPSYANVSMVMQHDTINETLIIDVGVYWTDSVEVDGFGFSPINYLNVVLVQDSVPGPQSGASQFNPGAIINGPWQPTYSHQHMVRDYVTPLWGDQITYNQATLPGFFVITQYIYEIPQFINDIAFVVDHIEAIAFVTENQQGDIITGASAKVTWPSPPPVAVTEIIPIVNDNIIYDIYGRTVTDIKKNTIYIKNNKKFIQF